MAARVLVLGLDPSTVPGLDADAITTALRRGQDRFAEHRVTADIGLVPLAEGAEEQVARLLQQAPYECVVIGGGIRKPEPLVEFFETVVNLVRRYAPQAAIAFNTSPEDSSDAALRWLSP